MNPENMIFHEVPRETLFDKESARIFYCGLPPNLAAAGTINDAHVRLYNKELILGQRSSTQEAAIYGFLSGVSAPGDLVHVLYSAFCDGLIGESVHSRLITPAEMRQPEIAAAVARKVAHVHRLPVPAARSYEQGFNAMEGYVLEAKANAGNVPPSPALEALQIILAVPWENEINYVHSLMLSSSSPVVFAIKNLAANNLHVRAAPTTDVMFHSLEYSGYNHRAFDLGDYLIESSTETRPDANGEVNFYLAPLPEATVASYLSTYMAATSDNPVLSRSYQQLYDEMLRGRLASHLFWGTWAMYAATRTPHNSNVLMNYAQFRLEQYLNEKTAYPELAAGIPSVIGAAPILGRAPISIVVTDPFFNGPHYAPWKTVLTAGNCVA